MELVELLLMEEADVLQEVGLHRREVVHQGQEDVHLLLVVEERLLRVVEDSQDMEDILDNFREGAGNLDRLLVGHLLEVERLRVGEHLLEERRLLEVEMELIFN